MNNTYKVNEEAVKKIAERVYDNGTTVINRNDLEEMFPELKEPDDERIRKEIMELVMQPTWKTEKEFHRRKELCTWLEKQVEKPNTVYDKELSEILGCVICRYINDPNISYSEREKVSREIIPYVERLEKQCEQKVSYTTLVETGDGGINALVTRELHTDGEQKPVDKVEPKFKAGDCIKPIDSCLGSQRTICEVCDGWYVTNQGTLDFEYENNWELVEQKPAWSEEDETVLDNLIYALANDRIGNDRDEYVDWLKSLKDRVQPKQEWSEEDEKLYNDLSDTYFYNDEDYPEETYKLMLKRVLDWMTKRAKSLRPQSRWKPNEDELLKGLDEAAKKWDLDASCSPIAMLMEGGRPVGTKEFMISHEQSFRAGVNWIMNKLKG